MHIPALFTARRIARERVDATAARYPNLRGHGDKADGYRHLSGAIMLTGAIGLGRARIILEGHERSGMQDGVSPGDTAQDLINNYNGMTLRENNPNVSVEVLVTFAFKNGYVQESFVTIKTVP